MEEGIRMRIAEATGVAIADVLTLGGGQREMGSVRKLSALATEALREAEQVQVLTLPEVGKGSPSFALGEARGLIREALGIVAELREQCEMLPPRGAEGYAESMCDDAIAALTKALEVTK
ncbi:MAG: hypothetical protein VW362_11015 [Candidatus Nanopelagicales bacterium]